MQREFEEGWAKLMTQTTSISGMVFGKLTVLSREGSDPHGKATWAVECECGTRLTVRGDDLLRGRKKDCGCVARARRARAAEKTRLRRAQTAKVKRERKKKAKAVDVRQVEKSPVAEKVVQEDREETTPARRKAKIGERFGKLVILRKTGIDDWSEMGFIALCDCMTEIEVNENALLDGSVTDCGRCSEDGQGTTFPDLDSPSLVVPWRKGESVAHPCVGCEVSHGVAGEGGPGQSDEDLLKDKPAGSDDWGVFLQNYVFPQLDGSEGFPVGSDVLAKGLQRWEGEGRPELTMRRSDGQGSVQ